VTVKAVPPIGEESVRIESRRGIRRKNRQQGSRGRQWMAESFAFHVPGHEAKGGTKIEWDPKTRTLIGTVDVSPCDETASEPV